MSTNKDPAEYPELYPPDDPTRTTSPRQAMIEPLSPLESHLAEAEALERAASETSEAASETRRRGRIEAETHRISEEVTRRAQERRKAEQRRQAQLAVPPDTPSESSSRATTPLADATTDPLVWELASLHLPDSLAFKRILVPLDGSERAERAIPLAARIAQASRGSILLVQVVSPPISGPGLAPVATIEPLLDAASEYLKTMAHREELADIEVHRKALTGVSAAPALLEAIELYQCDLAVICSHGRSGLTRWALGSVAQKMAQHASVPVLVLRPDAGLTSVARPGQGPAVRALVALDGSPTAEAALLPAARLVAALAGPGHGALHLLRVLDLSAPGSRAAAPVLPYREAGEAALEDARTYLHAAAQRFGEGELAKLGLRVTWSVLDEADAAYGILDEAEGDGADAQTSSTDSTDSTDKPRYDLIAMATHGRTGLRLWALGSVTDRVLQTTRLPLLIIRPSAAAG